ncbi:AT-rich interactive domain-containing protein 5A [Aplochiton taeniatus]
MEIPDSTNDCEVESKSRASPEETEERLFVSSLYSFMKGRNTPIERIPHLGFKQINLWKIYKAVEKLGGYDSATARRLWKNVYDELGGSPGSTSAATCTRRHYERLLLPFERQLRGEEDKPLPPSKPRKQYKRSLDAKISKSEGKKKRTQSEKEMDSEVRPESASECETATRLPSVTWPDRPHPEQPEPDIPSQRPSVYPQCSVQPVLSPYPWPTNIASAAGEVISPLEKKKRMAQQASLHHPQPQSPSQEGGKERPSVIHRSPSPDLAPPSRPSSAGSPLPVSSSSSRSPSPYSISSDDCAALADERPSATSKPDSPLVHSGSFTPVSGCRGSGEPHSHSSSSTKPGYKLPQSRSNPCDDTMANAKKLNHMAPRLLHTEKKEKSRTKFSCC